MEQLPRASCKRLVPEGGRVCIVGAGTTGLLAAKTCLEEGLAPTVFEQTERIGGVWRLDDAPTRVAYESLYTNSSGSMMCISDYPLDRNLYGHFPRRQDICNYYEAYAGRFDVVKHIKFETCVVAVRREPHHWIVTTSCRGAIQQSLFDAVFICTGQFGEPAAPTLAGSNTFIGRILHSSQYLHARDLEGKRVVIVGIGNSALDISLEAARGNCTSVTVLCSNGAHIIPVADHEGRPVDQMMLTRLCSNLPSTVRQLLMYRMCAGTLSVFRDHGMPPLPAMASEAGSANLKEHVEYRRHLRNSRIE